MGAIDSHGASRDAEEVMKGLIEERSGKYPADSIRKKLFEAGNLVLAARAEISDLGIESLAPGVSDRILKDLMKVQDSITAASVRVGQFVKKGKK